VWGSGASVTVPKCVPFSKKNSGKKSRSAFLRKQNSWFEFICFPPRRAPDSEPQATVASSGAAFFEATPPHHTATPRSPSALNCASDDYLGGHAPGGCRRAKEAPGDKKDGAGKL
jgi:hypothetical protein